MRVTTAFNRILDVPGGWVESVDFTDAGIVVGVRLRSRRLRCPCGFTTRARYDTSRRRWRHLDMGACRVWIEADIRRLADAADGSAPKNFPGPAPAPATAATSKTSSPGWFSGPTRRR